MLLTPGVPAVLNTSIDSAIRFGRGDSSVPSDCSVTN